MATQKLLERAEGALAYTDEGSGPVVVLVPGMGDLKESYRFLGPRLVAAGYRAVTMDLRGMGGSTARWPTYTNAAIGQDILALLDHLKARSAAVIGNSVGAGAAAWAAAEAPHRISALVLIGPFVRVPQNAAVQRLILKLAFAPPWGRAAWGAYWSGLYPGRKPDDFAAYKARLLAMLGEPGRMKALNALLSAPKTDVEARLGSITARTLVVMGSKDPDFPDPQKEASEVAQLLRGKAFMVAGAGHYPQAEMPDLTTPPVLAFLSEAPAAA